MATRNTTGSARFLHRAPNKEPEPYYVPINGYGSGISKSSTNPNVPEPSKVIRPVDSLTSRTEVENPARRIVVIRNTKHPQLDQEPSDLGDFGIPNSVDGRSATSDGNKSIFLIRRHIAQPETQKSVESYEPAPEPSSTISLVHTRTPTPSEQIATSFDRARSSSPPHSPPIQTKSSKRPTSSKRSGNSRHYVPYLRRPKTVSRTTSPMRTKSTHRSSSPTLPPSVTQEESKETTDQGIFYSISANKSTFESTRSPYPEIIENEQQTVQSHPVSRVRSDQRKRSAGSRPRSVVLVHSDGQSVAIVENSYGNEEPVNPITKRPASFKRARFQDDIDDDSTETSLNRSRSQRCLGCLSRHMCFIIIICFIVILIGLAGVGVSIYFLVINTSANLVPTVIGIAIGGTLTILAFCFLCILLACIGAHDGYFTYNDDGPNIGGRAFALIPPTHPNARLYIPRDYMKVAENSHHHPPPPPPSASVSNAVYRQSSFVQPVSMTHYNQQPTLYSIDTSISGHENKPNKNNIIIEMPERLLTGRKMSPRSHERNLNKVVKNIGYAVDDAKKRYNGNVPNKVIVKVDENSMQTA